MRKYVQQLADGDQLDGVFLLGDKQLRVNRNANLYLLVDLRDRTGGISSRMWNVTETSTGNLVVGELVQARGKVQLFQGGLQVILTHIFPISSEGLDMAEFLPRMQGELSHLEMRLKEILLGIGDRHLKAIMESFLLDEALMRQFVHAPAGIRAHHAYQGGLLEHVVTMLEMAGRIRDLYPQLNVDLLQAGVFLHDFGKVRELHYETGFTYTDEGQLLGHIVLILEILTDKIRETESILGETIPMEKILRLKHLIVSHHGSYEFGSPKLPMTPEAVALNLLDNFDAKIHEFTKTIEEDPNIQSNWTPFNARLDRKLFKGIRNGNL